ncbi:hypothetical protein [Vreelandella sp. GE22]
MAGRFNLHQRNLVGQRCRQKGGPLEPGDHELSRSCGGLTKKIHMVCDRHGFKLDFSLSAGQRADSIYLTEQLEKRPAAGLFWSTP